MWPFVVVEMLEVVEGALLGAEGVFGRSAGGSLEGFVHALMGAVFLWGSGSDALVLDTQPHPPDVELGKAVDTAGGEGDAVVGTDGVG